MRHLLFKNTYFHRVDHDWVGVYNPLKDHKILFLKNHIANELLAFKIPKKISSSGIKGVANPLLEHKFLLPEHFDQNTPIYNIASKINNAPHISLMYLLVTTECNLNCSYCFIEGDFHRGPQIPMTVATCYNAIDYFARIADKDIDKHSVVFYGGEPLLNAEVVKKGCIKLREVESAGRLNNLEIIINTNGLFVDSWWAKFFKKHRVTPSVSIDGPELIHNMQRKTVGGNTSFKKAYEGFKLFKEEGLPIGISCTISADNLDSLEDVAKFFVNEAPTGIGFNPLIGKAHQLSKSDLQCKTPMALVKAFEILRSAGIYEDRVMRRLEKFIRKEIYTKECAAYGNQVVISPLGEIGPCHGFLGVKGFFKGNVNGSPVEPESDNLFCEWNNRTPFRMKSCFDCPFIGICGGGCAYTAYIENKDIWAQDSRMKQHCKTLLNWIIEDVWRSNSGLITQ